MTTLGDLQTSLADVGIPGVRRVYTGADAPREVYARDLPLLMPDPDSPVETIRSRRLTLGGAGWVRTWTLLYVCLVAEIGAGRAPRDYAERAAQVADAVQAALCDWTPDGVHRVDDIEVRDFGPQRTRQYYGFGVRVTVITSY